RQVGPAGAPCTSAAWSPDGSWMYFTSGASGAAHIWRQRLDGGAPEQITFGPTEQQGVEIASDGRSLITSVGLTQSSVWVADERGEREVSAEGFADLPVSMGAANSRHFSPDGKGLYFFVRQGSTRAFVGGEVWMADLEAGRSERLLPGFAVSSFDISPDGKRIVFCALDSQQKPNIWLAMTDRSAAPQRLPLVNADSPLFGPGGDIFFRAVEGSSNFVYRCRQDGSGQRKALDFPVLFLNRFSPDGKWIVAVGGTETQAFPLDGGQPVSICKFCPVGWSQDGKTFYLELSTNTMGGNQRRVVVLPVPAGKVFPQLPSSGVADLTAAAALPGVEFLDHASLAAGLTRSTYAFVRTSVHRNLYRIPLN
ncbi:MAG: TolB family protein, partial [Acidobacteriota bacterium]